MNILKRILIWLNTPRSVDVPIFSDSKDADLYDELRRQQALLSSRKSALMDSAADFIRAEFLRKNNYIPSDNLVNSEAAAMFCEAEEQGLITELYELVCPKEAR